MIEGEASLDRGLMIEIEEDTLHSLANPEIITIQEGHTEYMTIIEIEVTTDNKGSEVSPYPPSEDQSSIRLQAEIMTDVSVVDSLVTLPKTIWRRTIL